MVRGFLIACLLLLASPSLYAAPEPRTVIAVYDSKIEQRLRFSNVHQLAAMPLNHLGLVVEFQDIRAGLPDLSARGDVRGVLLWLSDARLDDPHRLWTWLDAAIAQGRRLAIIGDLPVNAEQGANIEPSRVNETLNRIGLQFDSNWDPVTYKARIVARDAGFVEFERKYDEVLPPFIMMRPVGRDAVSHLTVRRSDGESHPVITTARGGYIAPGYAFYRDPTYLRTQWYVDPFRFFARVFATDSLPKPDTTTLAGRRMYYSHIDGDGWQNVSQVPDYVKRRIVSAEVILREVIEPYPDLPVTVAPVVAEIDPAWRGNDKALAITRTIFAMPQVEPASHTYTHPFSWSFFENYRLEKEAPFQPIYRSRGMDRYKAADEHDHKKEAEAAQSVSLSNYRLPRAYGDKPFDLDIEIGGAVAFLKNLVPPGKTVGLVQWPGDTSPFAAAIRKTVEARISNINGGDSRFDAEYPSYSSVAPVGVRSAAGIQVYASNSNENTYTDLWSNRYFNFRAVQETWRRTEGPRRVKPINHYYHVYSAEKLASLNALKANLDWVRRQEVLPLATTQFAHIVEGFFDTAIETLGERHWQISQRGALSTLRFDGALAGLRPDYRASRGILGHRRSGDSLYVALDPAVDAADLLLTADTVPAVRPVLEQARWQVSGLTCTPTCVMQVQGFGAGEFAWRVEPRSLWTVRYQGKAGTDIVLADQRADTTGLLSFSLTADAIGGGRLELERRP